MKIQESVRYLFSETFLFTVSNTGTFLSLRVLKCWLFFYLSFLLIFIVERLSELLDWRYRNVIIIIIIIYLNSQKIIQRSWCSAEGIKQYFPTTIITVKLLTVTNRRIKSENLVCICANTLNECAYVLLLLQASWSANLNTK